MMLLPKVAHPSADSGHRVLRREMRIASLQHDPLGLAVRDSSYQHHHVHHRGIRHRGMEEPVSFDSALATLRHLPHSVMIRDFSRDTTDGP